MLGEQLANDVLEGLRLDQVIEAGDILWIAASFDESIGGQTQLFPI